MPRLAEFDPAAATDPEAFQGWLAALPADGAERLKAIGRLLVRFGHREANPDALVGMLEQVRLALLPAVVDCLAPLEGRQIPYGAEVWRRLADALTTMRALRTMFRRAASRMTREGPAPETGADEPARRALPLIRALDLQSRILATLLVHRVEPLSEDWDEFCALGRHARATGLLDAQVPDALPLVRPVTARALFVYPLLLRLAGLPERSREDAAAAARLASRVAAQIGFRVDPGEARPNQWGPALALTGSWSARLDTHRVPSILARRRERSPAPGASEAADALIAELQRRWTGEAGPAPAERPPLDGPTHGVLHFGLPRRVEAPERRPQSGPGRAEAGYVFGQWERNTIVRLSMAGGDERPSLAGADPLAAAEPARFQPNASGRILVERSLMLPPALLGGLVALRFDEPASPVRLGAVQSVEQLATPGYERIRCHRVSVALWPGGAAAAGLRMGAARFFDDAWVLRAQPGGPAARDTLVTAPGLVAAGGRAVLREGGRDRSIRFTAVLERGPGFERVGFVVDDMVED